MSDFKLLMKTVINNSDSHDWHNAVYEWDIVSMEENEDADSICVCGNTGLRYLYEIENKCNGNILFPIGSTCIKQFERDDLNEELSNREMMFKLINSVKQRQMIHLKSDLFSRKFLSYLYEHNAFAETKYNNFDSYNDYKFMLDMFNKRELSTLQQRKTTAITMNSIIPYVRSQIRGGR